jgi:hypothetical protein
VQFSLPDGSVTVQPGSEGYYCYYNTLQQNTVVGAFQSWMAPGSSHHFITFEETPQHADGEVSSCAFGSGNWRYATSVSGQIIELKFPDTVGLQIAAGQQIDMNMHFLNAGSSPANPVVKLNLVYAQNVQNYATAMISFNAGINVPAGGMQTVNGTCTAPGGSNFFTLTTHTHKWATNAQVNLVRGGQTTNIVNTTDWEKPDTAIWNGPTWLTMGPGDSFTYSCTYSNSGPIPITVGETATSNEMCMAIGYFFPTGTASCL